MVNRKAITAIVAVMALCWASLAVAGQSVVTDRHSELKNESITAPQWPAYLPEPLHERAGETYWITIDNTPGGSIVIRHIDERIEPIGKVLSPVTGVNVRGFTASGWGRTGAVCASAVNAIHLKTDHDFGLGRGTIFSILPIDQAKVDPANYKSYISHETSLQTDIKAGSSIFGGKWTPLVGSKLYCCDADWMTAGEIDFHPVQVGYIPREGDILVIEVQRRRYNPEYVEFTNSYGGLIWIKELGRDPYPIGQVLKPVVGTGRFLGTTYAESGRIRAVHPGVICLSTSPEGTVGGFQIIPRDHAMSPEMIYTRYKTQWMVVGPLWALDPSWEGLPPLFSDYLYPSYTPVNEDGESGAASAMETYLSRFTVRGRYSDAEDPEQYVILREESSYNNFCLKYLTHVRIYFPVNLRLPEDG